MRSCFLLLTLSYAGIVAADEVSAPGAPHIVGRIAPVFPASESQRGREGWVTFNLIVNEKGEVVDPVIELSSGSAAFERMAMDSVKKWKYQPKIENGEPVQLGNVRATVSFKISNSVGGVSEQFSNKYEELIQTLEGGTEKSVEIGFDKLFKSDNLTRGELSWLWVLQSRIAESQRPR